MEDASRVAVSDSGDELLEESTAEIFREAAGGQLGEELAAFGELHDEVDLGFGGEDFGELDDVGVAKPPHDGNLAADIGREPVFEHLVLADALDGGALRRGEFPGVVDLGEGSSPEKTPEGVLPLEGLLSLVRHWCELRRRDGGDFVGGMWTRVEP